MSLGISSALATKFQKKKNDAIKHHCQAFFSFALHAFVFAFSHSHFGLREARDKRVHALICILSRHDIDGTCRRRSLRRKLKRVIGPISECCVDQPALCVHGI